jgi:hypothetical protein
MPISSSNLMSISQTAAAHAPQSAPGRHSDPARRQDTTRKNVWQGELGPAPCDIEPGSKQMPREELGHPYGVVEFDALRLSYRASGGLVCGDELARALEDRGSGGFVSLAKLIVCAEVFGFEWRHGFWVPMFQFSPEELTIKPATKAVLAELGSAFDDWDLATWFVRPNSWLGERRPLDLLQSELPSVLQAARADRFAATG